MENSDEKKVNYELFEKTISELTDLHKELEDEKRELQNNNTTLTEESNWKGVSRNYYKNITVKQEKVFEKINDSFKNLISSLNDTLKKFDSLDKNIASKFEK